jgi:hypothetical protein
MGGQRMDLPGFQLEQTAGYCEHYNEQLEQTAGYCEHYNEQLE